MEYALMLLQSFRQMEAEFGGSGLPLAGRDAPKCKFFHGDGIKTPYLTAGVACESIQWLEQSVSVRRVWMEIDRTGWDKEGYG